MSIPPIPAAGAAAKAVKASSTFAAEVVQGVSEKIGTFAGVLAGSDDASAGKSATIDLPDGGDLEPTPITKVIEELKEALGLIFEGSIELRLDGHGQINVTSEQGFADQDFESRMKLQSHINGDESVRTRVAEALAGQSVEVQP